MGENMYDVIIMGAGFAGFSAAIYAVRSNLKTLVISKAMGGAIVDASKVENYPGYKEISGLDLMKKFEEQAKGLGTEIITGEVINISQNNNSFKLNTKKQEFEAKTIIFATGTERRKMNVPGSKEFEGKGLHYCATCDGVFYKDKVVAVIGGSNSAAHAALLLTQFAKKVYIIYRKEKMRCEPILLEKLENNKIVEFIYKNNVSEVKGDKFVNKAVLEQDYKNNKELNLDGIFVEIGSFPSSKLAEKLGVKLTNAKEIIVNAYSRTNIKAVFAAGDVTNTVMKQGITAAAQGAIAATGAYHFITGKITDKEW